MIKRDAGTLMVSMGFKNIGPNVIRWEMEEFTVKRTKPIRPSNHYDLFRVEEGTLGPQDPLLFGPANLTDIGWPEEVEGELSFSVLYGPPQRPRAFRIEEVWKFVVSPEGVAEVKVHAYKAKTLDEPMVP